MQDEVRRTFLSLMGLAPLLPMACRDGLTRDAAPEGEIRNLYAAQLGVKGDGVTDDTAALQSALDLVIEAPDQARLILPAGDILLKGNIVLGSEGGNKSGGKQVILQGAGAGTNGSWLRFSEGSLIISAANHSIRDIRVTSETGNGIEIKPSNQSRDSYPARSEMSNVRAEHCRGSGITIEDCWIYLMSNVFARFNVKWGLEGRSGAKTRLACNALTIIGGEFQGNGSTGGARLGHGGSRKGAGGGIFTGRCVQFTVVGSTIEGNRGDGIALGEELRGLTLQGVYFEKNGSHPSNRDIIGDPPSSPGLGPNAGFIVNCNFTPQNLNGEVQERAIELCDFHDLRIVNPQFFARSGGIVFSAEPIRVWETGLGRATGWVEGGHFGASAYTQDMIKNETFRFGYPVKHIFSPDLTLPASGSERSENYFVPMSNSAGRRVDVNHYTRPDGGTGTARIVTTIRRGPAGTRVAIKSDDVTYRSSTETVRQTNFTSYTAAAWQHAEVTVERHADHPGDTLATGTQLQGVEVITYEAIISASRVPVPRT